MKHQMMKKIIRKIPANMSIVQKRPNSGYVYASMSPPVATGVGFSLS